MLQTLASWPRLAAVVVCLLLILGALLAGAIAFGTAAAPSPKEPRQLDLAGLPAPSRFTARDGTELAYREYPGGGVEVVVLVHGSGTESSVMHPLAKALQADGVTVYAPDLRGHGGSGRRGDIAYIGQLDDDLADLVAVIRRAHGGARLTLIGFSGGGAFAIRIAGGSYGPLFDRFILIDPAIVYPSALARPNAGGWAAPAVPRIVGLMALNLVGIHWFDGLTAIRFAVPPGNLDLTGAYSFRLAMNLGSSGYAAALARAKQPMALIAGADDDQFYAERYGPLLQAAKPDLTVELVPGLDHVDMLTQPAAQVALVRTFKALAH